MLLEINTINYESITIFIAATNFNLFVVQR
jgi:hypothetical protein